jgi:hypothetical protein
VIANGTTSKWGTARADYLCDGVNDEVQIQAAIDWVNGQGGGTVMLSRGTFYVAAPIAMKGTVRLIGAGRRGTVLKIPNAIAASFTRIDVNAEDYITMAAFSLDGNGAGIGAFEHRGIYIRGGSDGINLFDLEIKELNQTAAAGFGLQLDSARTIIAEGLHFYNCEGGGFEVNSTADRVQVLGCHATDSRCKFDGDHQAIIGLNASSSLVLLYGSASQMIGGHVLGSAMEGIIMDGAHRFLVEGVHVGLNGFHGISLATACAEVAIKNCHIETNSQDVDDTYEGIHVNGTTNTVLAGNTIRHGGGAKQHKYGIGVVTGSAASGLFVYGNDLRTSGRTSPWVDVSGYIHTFPEYNWDGAAQSHDDPDHGNIIA